MHKIRSENLLPTLAAAALLAFGCGDGGSSSSGPPSPPSPGAVAEADLQAPIERVEIPIDGSDVSTEASLERNFYFIFDGSGSMREPPEGECRGERTFTDKLEGARWALREFLAKVPEDVRIGLYVFDLSGQGERVPLGSGNRETLLGEIETIRASGGTPLAEAIRYGTDRLVEQYQRQLGYGEFRLVVVTDGIAEDIPEAARYATARGMPIYAIGLCIGEEHPLRRYAVSYRAADSFEDLARGLEETLAELPDYDVAEFETPTREE